MYFLNHLFVCVWGWGGRGCGVCTIYTSFLWCSSICHELVEENCFLFSFMKGQAGYQNERSLFMRLCPNVNDYDVPKNMENSCFKELTLHDHNQHKPQLLPTNLHFLWMEIRWGKQLLYCVNICNIAGGPSRVMPNRVPRKPMCSIVGQAQPNCSCFWASVAVRKNSWIVFLDFCLIFFLDFCFSWSTLQIITLVWLVGKAHLVADTWPWTG